VKLDEQIRLGHLVPGFTITASTPALSSSNTPPPPHVATTTTTTTTTTATT